MISEEREENVHESVEEFKDNVVEQVDETLHKVDERIHEDEPVPAGPTPSGVSEPDEGNTNESIEDDD